MKKTTIFIVLALLCLNFWARGQSSIIIPGSVQDENGFPIKGATIQLAGTSSSTFTNANGNFSLPVSRTTGTIIISHLNFNKINYRYDLTKKEKILITLTENYNSLEEVRIIGYGQTTRKLNTGSSGSLSAKEIEKQPVTNILSSLSGRIAGVAVQTTNGLPGGGISIRIRGKGSLLAGSDPLYIVDGMPYNTTIGTLNGSANALALQAVNGSTNPLNSINPDDIENITVLKDADATSIYGSRGTNGVVLITTKKGKTGKPKYNVNFSQSINQAANLPKLLSLDGYLTMRKEAFSNDGRIPSADPLSANYAPDLLIWDQSEGKDWAQYLMGGTGNASNLQASITGGNEQTTFLIGGNFRNEGTILPGTNRFQRGGFQANLNYTSKNQKFKLQFGNTLSIGNNRLTNSASIPTSVLLPPNYPIYNPDGSFNWTYVNPLAEQNAYTIAKTFNLNSNVSLDYEIIEGMRLKGNAGLSRISLDQVQVFPSSSMGPSGINYTAFGKNSNESFIVEPQLNYQKQINKFNIQALLGGTYQSTDSNGESIKGENFSSESLMENVGSAGTLTALNSFNEYRYLSAFARLTLNYGQRYILNATIRRDGSSRFGEGKRFGNFGSIAAAWIFSEETWLKENFSWLSFGKLRSSYGHTGNDQISPYQYLSSYGSSPYTYNGIPALRPTRIANDNFHWETTRKTELALELGFLNNKILLTTNFYLNRSNDQLVSYKIPYLTGFANYQANLPAVVENRGLEIELNTDNINGESFSWKTSFNLTIPRNTLRSFENFESSSYAQTLAIGYDITRIYGYQSFGVNPSTGLAAYADVNGGTTLPPYFFNTIGKQTQDLYGGLGNSFTYKNFALDFFFQFAKQSGVGSSIYTPGIMLNDYHVVSQRWRTIGDVTNIPRASNTIDYNFVASSANYYNSNYLRLKNINLSYDLKGKILKNLKMDRLRIYFQAQNLITFWNRDHPFIDPESGAFSPTSPNFPPMKTLLIGIQTQF